MSILQMTKLRCREFNLPKIPWVVGTVTEDTHRISIYNQARVCTLVYCIIFLDKAFLVKWIIPLPALIYCMLCLCYRTYQLSHVTYS